VLQTIRATEAKQTARMPGSGNLTLGTERIAKLARWNITAIRLVI
jgi:hypothetical protein